MPRGHHECGKCGRVRRSDVLVHSRWTGKWFCFDLDTGCAHAAAKRDHELRENYLAAELGLVDHQGQLVDRRPA